MGREVLRKSALNGFKDSHPGKSEKTFKTCTTHSTETGSLRSVALVALVAVFSSVTYNLLTVITREQPSPFIDEVCHIPQAQEYCRGNFTYWDQRITTLPGLYLLSVGILRPLSLWKDTFLCDSFNLRLVNVCLAVCNLVLYVYLTDSIHAGKGYCRWKGLLSAFNLAILPPLYFFSFLYYTDVAATCLMLLVLCLHLSGNDSKAAFASLFSVLMRQTNIVWTVFCAARSVDSILSEYFVSADVQAKVRHSWMQIPATLNGMFSAGKRPLKKWTELGCDVLKHVIPYVLVGILFAGFVYWNQGLVVGDRSAHVPTVHIPQMFYFFAFATFFGAAHFLCYVKPFSRAVTSNVVVSLVVVTLITAVIRYNTLVHTYLLSDNRHFTFYVWMRIFEHNPYGRYTLWPVYVFGGFCVYRTVIQKQSFLTTLAFFVCCILALILQKLVECRYFIIPFILARLHVKPDSWLRLVTETLMYVFINAATIYLFLTKTFTWPDTSEPQRIIW